MAQIIDDDLIVNGIIRARDGFRPETNDWEIARSGEHLEIREPEQAGKVWARFNDDQSLHLIGTPNLRVDGTVGVNTTSPRTTLHVVGRISSGLDFNTAGAMTFYPPDGFAWFHIDNGPSGGRPVGRLRISHGNAPGDQEVVSILQNGRVGIGTDDPGAALHVVGSIRASGDVILENADCAEEFDAPDGAEAGTVMSLNDDASVSPCAAPYDPRVAGVVSGAGAYQPALLLDRREGVAGRAPLAMLGKVFCKADAGGAPIRVGDLLTTAERPGHAMRALDRDRAFGATLGKALAPLDRGLGLIPVLVALR